MLRCVDAFVADVPCLAFALRTCVGPPNLRTCLAFADVRWGAQLGDVPCVAEVRWAALLADVPEAVLKSLPAGKNLFLSILQLIF